MAMLLACFAVPSIARTATAPGTPQSVTADQRIVFPITVQQGALVMGKVSRADAWDRPERAKWFGGGYDHPAIHSICLDPRDPNTLRVAVPHYLGFFNFTEAQDPVGSRSLGGFIVLTEEDVDDIVAYLQLL